MSNKRKVGKDSNSNKDGYSIGDGYSSKKRKPSKGRTLDSTGSDDAAGKQGLRREPEYPVTPKRIKISTQVREDILSKARGLADAEGRKFQYVVEEALSDYIVKETNTGVRPFVMRHFRESVKANKELYKKLAE